MERCRKNKRFRLKSHFIITVLLTFCSAFFLNHSYPSAANTENNLKDIQEKLSSTIDALRETTHKEQSEVEQLKNINRNIKQKEAELNRYSSEVAKTQSEIQKLSEQVDALSGNVERNLHYMEEVIIAFYKQQYEDNALIFLSASDYQDLMQKMKYSSLIAHYDSNVINTYGEQLKQIEAKRAELEALQNELRDSVENAKNKKYQLHRDREGKDQVLARLKARKRMYEKNIEELEQSSQKVQSMLKGIRSEALPRSIVGKGFKTLKGSLPLPVEGEIMRPYEKDELVSSNVSAFKSGIEILAKPDDLPETVAGGRVVFADSFKGYGKLVIVDHGDGYHSLYGNLSEVSLEEGSIVIQGFKVGKVGISRTLNTPALYFEIRHRGKPVDPKVWLNIKPRVLSLTK